MRVTQVASLFAILGVAPGQVEGPKSKPQPAAPLSGAAQTAFLKLIKSKMSSLKSVVAAFEQTKHISLFGDDVKTHGFILYSRPDLLRWEIQKPFQSILIVAKSDVAKFEFREGERRRLKLGRSADVILLVMDQIRSWFRGDFRRSANHYDLTVFPAGKTAARIHLRPKNKAMHGTLKAIELELSKSLEGIARVTIRESSGDYTVMKFRPLHQNIDLPQRFFDPQDPSAFNAQRFQTQVKKPAVPPSRRGESRTPDK